MTTAQALAARWNNQQIAAIHLAIAALERERRRLYAAGNAAYNQGIRTDVVNSDGVTGELFTFAEDSHKGYKEYTDAINALGDMIEILQDPGAVVLRETQMELV
jgi:hypothetical protein